MTCGGSVDLVHVLKPPLGGAGGILVGGCHPGDCHYQERNYWAQRRVTALKEILTGAGGWRVRSGYGESLVARWR